MTTRAMTTALPLPGTLEDLLAVGMVVHEHAHGLHTEFDPALWRARGGLVHTVGADRVGVVAVGVPGRPDGLVLDEIPLDRIHQCDTAAIWCPYAPAVAKPTDVRYTARWLLRVVGRGKGRLDDHDRRLIHIAVTLLTKAVC